jgi:CBS domain-containing protein
MEMKVIETLRRSKVVIRADETVHAAAVRMQSAGVGALAVVDHDRLVGIVTDRDLVRRAMATRMPSDARIDSVMSSPVITIEAEADLHDVFPLFRTNAVRRIAVVRGDEFLGMMTVDDLLIGVAAALDDLVKPVTAEVIFGGHRDAPVPART